MTLLELCDWYTAQALSPSSQVKVREDIFNLCIEYLMEDNPKLSTVKKLKEFFGKN